MIAMNTPKKVVVVGAGIGGLTAALALLERGIDVEVYEQSNELKEAGAGIQISSNGTRVLFALGLEKTLAQVQVRSGGSCGTGAPVKPGTGSIAATRTWSRSAHRTLCC